MPPKDFYVKGEPDEERDVHGNEFMHVHSIGIYSCEDDNMIRSSRGDYLIAYPVKGTLYFKADDGGVIPVEAGKAAFYRPDENYCLYKTTHDEPMCYWIHFTGYGVEKMTETLGYGDRNIFNVGISVELKDCFIKIIDEMQVTNKGYEIITAGKTMELLSMIARLDFTREITQESNPIIPALEYMHQNYKSNQSVDFYASLCNMSKYYFIRTFKTVTNTTPVEYLKTLRMTKAIDLLERTHFKISEISRMVGYQDPLYFNRLFKKTKGMSPTEYRVMVNDQE